MLTQEAELRVAVDDSSAKLIQPLPGLFRFDREPANAGADWVQDPAAFSRTHYALLPDAETATPCADYPFKRVFDVVASLALMVLFCPLAIFIAVMIWTLDPGPVLFSQERIGVGGRRFTIWKFRTMRTNSDELLTDLYARDETARREWLTQQKLHIDPRVTRLGLILRMSSMDELPQLINVLRGEMSLVGPRPIVPNERARYRRRLRNYQMVKPGITGLWQVSGRNNTTYARRVAMDVLYSRRVSLGFDLYILLKTIPAVLAAEGCY